MQSYFYFLKIILFSNHIFSQVIVLNFCVWLHNNSLHEGQLLPQDNFKNVKEFVTRTKEREFVRSKSRQQCKLQRLLEEASKFSVQDLDLSGTQLKKWVVNISKHKLTQGETSVLAKGLSFAVTPQKLPVEDFVVATEQAILSLKEPKANLLRNDVLGILKNARPPQPNINAEERKAMKDLASNKDITILPADKGKATVIMDTQDYKDKVSSMLSDKKTYELLTSDPTSSYKRKLIALLKPLKEGKKITSQQYDYLYPTAENVPRLYCTPKTHKEGIPLRPIVDYIGSIGYNTSRSLADILSPLVGKTEHHVKNSKDLAEEFRDITLDEQEVLVSFDVVSLFTNTPIGKSIEIVKDRLQNDTELHKKTKLSVEDIIKLLEFICSTTYFSFDRKIYRQKFGAAMGSPVSPIVANIYMEHLEQEAIVRAQDDIKPRVWKRYVDDILAIVKRDSVDRLKALLDQVDDTGSIKFTHELEVDNSIPFLDARIVKKPDGKNQDGRLPEEDSHRPISSLSIAPSTPPEVRCYPHPHGQSTLHHHGGWRHEGRGRTHPVLAQVVRIP